MLIDDGVVGLMSWMTIAFLSQRDGGCDVLQSMSAGSTRRLIGIGEVSREEVEVSGCSNIFFVVGRVGRTRKE